MATYYIAANGSTSNVGTSPNFPWPLSKVGSVTYAAGDIILFNKGDTFSGTIAFASSGSSGNPITFDFYGDAADNPIIDGGASSSNVLNITGNYITINNLVFHPGLSTADQVTSISGRGVGMDVVKSVLEKLKGSVSIKTTPGKGTTFYLKVPLTLAIIKALLFRVGDRLYAVPLASVVEITRTTRSALHRVDNHDVMQLRNEVLMLLHLHQLATESTATDKMFVVVISNGEKKFGLVVDHLVGEEELVIKAMDDHLVATDMVSGASILGDGRVVLILNLSSVVAKLGKLQMVGATA